MATQTELSVSDDLEPYRRELTGYCYRMLGSGAEAEDAVQETFLRAWRKADSFEGRASIRSWLYRIATNVCIDLHRRDQRRIRPVELGPASAPVESNLGPMLLDDRWVTPIPDARVAPDTGDPADIAAHRETVRLAFVTALQHLPPKQRAVLIFCEVLRWQASEVADLLETTTASVNSALQRARATLAALPEEPHTAPLDEPDAALLQRYVEAFEAYDIDRFVQLLHEDAVQTMPPFAMWLRGALDIGRWMVEPGPSGCRGSRLLPTSANGGPAYGQYRRDRKGGFHPWALVVVEISGGRVTGINSFLETAQLFPAYGLPLHLEA